MLVVKRMSLKQEDAQIKFNLDNHIEEILSGVREANENYNGQLEVQEIEVVPNDYPRKGQAKCAAYKIAEYVLAKSPRAN